MKVRVVHRPFDVGGSEPVSPTDRQLLNELYEWALWACAQGTMSYYGAPEWHMYISTWQDAEDLLPRVAEALGRDLTDDVQATAAPESEQP